MDKKAPNLFYNLINIGLQNKIFYKQESLLLLIFLISCFSMSAQQIATEKSAEVFELKSYISSANKKASQSKLTRNINTQNLENLIYQTQPSVYFYNGEVKTYGEKPKNLFTEITSIGKLDQTAMLKNNIEIITININNESQANQFIDTNSFSSFKNLKYIYLVFNFPISQTKIPNIIRNYNDKYSVFYNISIGDSN